MVTTVGSETSFQKLVTDLISLEYDAIAAYETCIERMEDKTLSSQVASFREDHLRHLATLTEIAREAGIEAPSKGDFKQVLTTGRAALASVVGDAAFLKAMNTNENDTVTAYERAMHHEEARPELKAFFMQAHLDEERHRAWMSTSAAKL